MNTDRVTVRAGDRVSRARMAMYSNPPSAPKPILPRMFTFSSEISGTCVRNGRYADSVPVTTPITGSSITVPKIAIMKMPPVLCTHLLTDNPRIDIRTISDSTAADASATNELLAVIHAALGPIAYERYVAHCRPISDVNTITYSHRFHASMKPTVWLKPSFAH